MAVYDLFNNPAYHPLDLTLEQVYLADELRFTRDPFDALIVAATRTLALPLLIRDADIPVRRRSRHLVAERPTHAHATSVGTMPRECPVVWRVPPRRRRKGR
jgi:hypothetical protein